MKSIFVRTALFLPAAVMILSACGGEASETTTESEVTLKPLVEVQKVEEKKFIHEIRVQGNIETDQDILLNAEMGGLITSVNVKEGQKVSKGQVIAQVDASILSSNMRELQTKLEYAQYMLEKQEQLHKKGVGSEIDLESAKNQVNSLKASMGSISTQQGKATIKAPFSGVIDQVFARQGQMAGPSAPVVRLVNNKIIDVISSVSEKHYSNIKVGTDMRVSFPNYGDTSITLQVTNVGNYIEPTNRTFRIKSTIKNNDYFLPNMLAEVSITDMEVENGLVIASKAVLKDQESNDYVYVTEQTKAGLQVKKVIIEVIENFNGETLIKPGSLKEGQEIVVGGARGITNNDIVRVK